MSDVCFWTSTALRWKLLPIVYSTGRFNSLKCASAEITPKTSAVEEMGALARLSIAFDLSAIDSADLKSASLDVFAGESCLEIAEG